MQRETSELLTDLEAFMSRFVAFPSPHYPPAVAAWVLHAHTIDAWESTPRLAILSAEKQSGKTRLLEVLDLVVPDSRRLASMSAASLFRLIDAKRPTVLLDEVDAIFSKTSDSYEDLRGMLNAGHRKSATIGRCVGEGANLSVKEFRVFCAVALAGIGWLPDTVMDRSVVLRMKRRAHNERVESFRLRKASIDAKPILRRCTAWAGKAEPQLRKAEPDMTPLEDRPADVWEPLVAIGDIAGGDWAARIRAASVAMSESRQEVESHGIHLLRDCRSIFASSGTDRLSTAQLLPLLHALAESPWADLHGAQLSNRQLARLLRQYDVRPKKIRFSRDDVAQGYTITSFHDAWQRYLPPAEPPSDAEQSEQAEPT